MWDVPIVGAVVVPESIHLKSEYPPGNGRVDDRILSERDFHFDGEVPALTGEISIAGMRLHQIG